MRGKEGISRGRCERAIPLSLIDDPAASNAALLGLAEPQEEEDEGDAAS